MNEQSKEGVPWWRTDPWNGLMSLFVTDYTEYAFLPAPLTGFHPPAAAPGQQRSLGVKFLPIAAPEWLKSQGDLSGDPELCPGPPTIRSS
jgi:hypothetical protein